MAKLLLFSSVILAGLGAMAADSADHPISNIVIGVLLPPEEAEALSLREGIELAVDEVNAQHANSMKVIIRGRVGQWGADAVEAARMVTDDGAQALIAPPSGAASHLALQVSGRTAIPVVSLCPDSSITRTGVPWLLRAVPRTTDEAEVLFNYLKTSYPRPPNRWTVLVPEGRAGREAAHDLNAAALNANCTMGKVIEVISSVPVGWICKEALKSMPDVVLLWLDPKSAAAIARALKEGGYNALLAGPGLLRAPEFTAAAGEAVEGFITTDIVRDEESKALLEDFTGTFQRRFGHVPGPTTAASYDAVRLLIQVLDQGHPGSAHRAFPVTSKIPGASGPLSFDSDGNRKVNLHILAARQGRFVPISTKTGTDAPGLAKQVQ